MQSDPRTCPLNHDVILLHGTKKCVALPTSTSRILCDTSHHLLLGAEGLRFLSGQGVGVRRGGPWVTKGNRE